MLIMICYDNSMAQILYNLHLHVLNSFLFIYKKKISCTAAYVAAKHALTGWTRSFGLLPQICDVRVNAGSNYFIRKSSYLPIY